MFCFVLACLDALLEFGRLVWSVMDLMVLLFFSGCFCSMFSEKQCSVLNGVVWSVARSAPTAIKQTISCSVFWKSRFNRFQRNSIISIQYFSAKFWLRIHVTRWDINLFSLSFFASGFAVEDVVEVGKSSARVWSFGTRCWGLSAWLMKGWIWLCYSSSATSPEMGMLTRPGTIVCCDIGLVVLSGLGSRQTHPVDVDSVVGATMARRARLPLRSIPAFLDSESRTSQWSYLPVWFTI
jgi:hypothetical protein